MEELLSAILGFVAELLLEVFFQVVLEAAAALVMRFIRTLVQGTHALSPSMAIAAYFLAGIACGGVSVLVFPHHLIHPSRIHGISLLISPLVTGFVMSLVGAVRRRRGKETVRIESFGYGFTFALGMAVIRLLFVR
jgi:hypothetical protein